MGYILLQVVDTWMEFPYVLPTYTLGLEFKISFTTRESMGNTQNPVGSLRTTQFKYEKIYHLNIANLRYSLRTLDFLSLVVGF